MFFSLGLLNIGSSTNPERHKIHIWQCCDGKLKKNERTLSAKEKRGKNRLTVNFKKT